MKTFIEKIRKVIENKEFEILNEYIKLKCALHYVAEEGYLDIVKYLVSKAGANIHSHNDKALRYAASKGHLDVVKYLVEAGANIHADDEGALRWAANNGYLDVVKYLVEGVSCDSPPDRKIE